MAKALSTRQMARELGVSGPRVCQLARLGMPMDDSAKAREWRALNVRARTRPDCYSQQIDSAPAAAAVPSTSSSTSPNNVVDLYATDVGAEELEATLPRLRRLEKATALALERAINADNITAAVALRREHCTALRVLYNAQEKLIKIQANRGRVISLSLALSMVNEALSAPILMLRRLPDLARDADEKARLTAFLNGVLEEVRRGAEVGIKRSSPVTEAPLG